jgi:ribosome-associated toxin RatA of RatAB toxin-antitoxin module
VATHYTKHDITVEAAADTVFELVADVAGWPQVFGPTVHVELLTDDGAEQLLRIWALANGEVRDWTSRRTLDRAAGVVAFQQVVSSPPVASMGGRWIVEPLGRADRSSVTLTHDFEAIADDPDAVAFIQQAVDRNSNAELAALKTAAEQQAGPDQLRFTFSDGVAIRGTVAAVFEFINRADLWPERLPHVSRLDLDERVPGVQRMVMDTRSPDGSIHTTESVRLCFPERGTIVYKQLRVPPVMSAHTGRWELADAPDGLVEARSWHTVTLNPEGVRQALGAEATMQEAREKVRHALGTNSLTTLRHAKQHVESPLE